MTKFKWKGPNNYICRDLMLVGALQQGEVLTTGKIIEIEDTAENELLISRLKRVEEPYFELVTSRAGRKKKKGAK